MGLRAVRVFTFASFLVFVAAAPCLADTFPVGVLSFDLLQTDPSGDLYGIDVLNATQPGGGSLVATMLSFEGLSLTVDLSSGGSMPVALSPTDAFGDLSTGAMFSAGDLLSATLTGSFSPTSVSLTDGSTVDIQADFSAVLTDAGGPLQDGDFALIDANTVAQSVPEPSSLLLLAIAIVLFFLLFLLFLRACGKSETWTPSR
jgi:hypothetical protein